MPAFTDHLRAAHLLVGAVQPFQLDFETVTLQAAAFVDRFVATHLGWWFPQTFNDQVERDLRATLRTPVGAHAGYVTMRGARSGNLVNRLNARADMWLASFPTRRRDNPPPRATAGLVRAEQMEGGAVKFSCFLVHHADRVAQVGEEAEAIDRDRIHGVKREVEAYDRAAEAARAMLPARGARSPMHAEDFWFPAHMDALVAAVRAAAATPGFQRVEFLDKKRPCQGGLGHPGCEGYFSLLATRLGALAGTVPIYVYTFRDDDSIARHNRPRTTYRMQADGSLVDIRNAWTE